MNSYPDTFKQVPQYGYPYPDKEKMLVVECRKDRTFRFARYDGRTHFELLFDPNIVEVKRGKKVVTHYGEKWAWAGDILRWRYAAPEESLKILAMQKRGSTTLAVFEP